MTNDQKDWVLVAAGLITTAVFLAHAWEGLPLDEDRPSPATTNEIARWNDWIEHCVKTDPVCRQNLEDLR